MSQRASDVYAFFGSSRRRARDLRKRHVWRTSVEKVREKEDL
jgi:hypothetical protein